MLMVESDAPGAAAGEELDQAEAACVASGGRSIVRSADAQGYGYTVFGKVVEGMDVVDRIAKAPTGSGGPFPKDVPVEKVIINKAVVVETK